MDYKAINQATKALNAKPEDFAYRASAHPVNVIPFLHRCIEIARQGNDGLYHDANFCANLLVINRIVFGREASKIDFPYEHNRIAKKHAEMTVSAADQYIKEIESDPEHRKTSNDKKEENKQPVGKLYNAIIQAIYKTANMLTSTPTNETNYEIKREIGEALHDIVELANENVTK